MDIFSRSWVCWLGWGCRRGRILGCCFGGFGLGSSGWFGRFIILLRYTCGKSFTLKYLITKYMAFTYGFYLCAIFLIHACLQRLFQWRNFFVIFTLFPLNTIITCGIQKSLADTYRFRNPSVHFEATFFENNPFLLPSSNFF